MFLELQNTDECSCCPFNGKLKEISVCFFSIYKRRLFSVFTYITPSKVKCKPFNTESPELIWEMKEDEYTKSIAKNQVCRICNMQDIWEKVLAKFTRLCMQMPCWCSFEGHKYGRQKPTETSTFEFFCKKESKYKRFCETIKFSQVGLLVLRLFT